MSDVCGACGWVMTAVALVWLGYRVARFVVFAIIGRKV